MIIFEKQIMVLESLGNGEFKEMYKFSDVRIHKSRTIWIFQGHVENGLELINMAGNGNVENYFHSLLLMGLDLYLLINSVTLLVKFSWR